MKNDSVREELQEKISAVSQSLAVGTSVRVNKHPLQSIPAVRSSATSTVRVVGEIGNGTATQIKMSKHTSQTVVGFQSKTQAIPEWRLQIQNAVRRRRESSPGSAGPVERSRPYLTEAAPVVPTTETPAKEVPSVRTSLRNPEVILGAMQRLNESRDKFELFSGGQATSESTPSPSADRNFPIAVPAPQDVAIDEPSILDEDILEIHTTADGPGVRAEDVISEAIEIEDLVIDDLVIEEEMLEEPLQTATSFATQESEPVEVSTEESVTTSLPLFEFATEQTAEVDVLEVEQIDDVAKASRDEELFEVSDEVDEDEWEYIDDENALDDEVEFLDDEEVEMENASPAPRLISFVDDFEGEVLEQESQEEELEFEQDGEEVAPMALRFNAGLIDMFLGAFGSIFLVAPFIVSGGASMSGAGVVAFFVTLAVVLWVYMTAMIGFTGRTLGMRVFSLEVIDMEESEYPSFTQAALSSSIYIATLALGGIGYVTALFNPEKRALHDLLSGTVVVREY